MLVLLSETSQFILFANQLTGFYMRTTLAFNGLSEFKLIHNFYSFWNYQKTIAFLMISGEMIRLIRLHLLNIISKIWRWSLSATKVYKSD